MAGEATTKGRDSDATRARIVAAVGEVMARDGFRKVGINQIARAAGVDKVLIYRYFGGLPELLEAFARQGIVWPTVEELLEDCRDALVGGNAVDIASAILIAHLRALRRRPLTQEIMRWELLERNELTDVLARAREEQGTTLFARVVERMGPSPASVDLPATVALLLSGLTYLLLRSHTAEVYLGVPLDTEEGWQRLEAATRRLVEGLFAAPAVRRDSPPCSRD